MTRHAEPVLLLQLWAVGTSCAGGRRDGSPSAKEEVATAGLGAAAFHFSFARDSLQPPFLRLYVNSGILPMKALSVSQQSCGFWILQPPNCFRMIQSTHHSPETTREPCRWRKLGVAEVARLKFITVTWALSGLYDTV